MTRERYSDQVELLLQVLPAVSEQAVFALKGGTAINLFVRDMPRLSVDIDLTYLPLQERDASIKGISKALTAIGERIKAAVVGSHVRKVAGATQGSVVSLTITVGRIVTKVEANTVLRGSVFPSETRELCQSAQTEFSVSVDAQLLSIPDLFGGKLCAVLDRQHPRDLFDAKLLLEREGLTDEIRRAFVVYLACHPRPIHELLSPTFLDMRRVFESEFLGMSRIPVSYDELEAARAATVESVMNGLSDDERQFLLSIKKGEPNWALLAIDGIELLPALQWKLRNIARMERNKHRQQIDELERCLSRY